MVIDTFTYRKDTAHPQRWGYQLRGSARPSSIIIHTTSNRRPTQFETEATFLRDSADVSAHYLVGKDGRIVQFLAPDKYQAWHAGAAIEAFTNVHSVGIEHHVSVGEAWTTAQHAASDWLVRDLMSRYGIARGLVDMHRAVALPKGRKADPAGWDDDSFYAWRNGLGTPAPTLPPPTKRYRARRVMISQRLEGGAPYAGEVQPGEVVEVDKWYTSNMVHLADGRGFVRLADLEAA